MSASRHKTTTTVPATSDTSHLYRLLACERFFLACRLPLDVPYYELTMSITKLRLLFHFRMGSHSLPVEQGRLARPGVPRHLRSCTFCPGRALEEEEEIHYVHTASKGL